MADARVGRVRAGGDAGLHGRHVSRHRAERAGQTRNARADEKRDAPTGGQARAGPARAPGQVQARRAGHGGPASQRKGSAQAEIYGQQEMIAVKTLLFTILVPGTVTVLVPYLLLTSGFQLFPVEIGALRVLGLPPILMGVV